MKQIFRYAVILLLFFAIMPLNAQTRKPWQKIRVGVMLPLHNVDGDGRRMTEYYRGMLLAFGQLKSEGYNIDVHAWNVNIDADIRNTLLDKSAAQCDMIFGPLYTKQVKPLAEFCQKNDIKLIIPFSVNSNEISKNSCVWQIYKNDVKLNESAIKAFLERFSNSHPVFVDCNDTTSHKGMFTFGLRKELEIRGIKYNVTNLKSGISSFAKAFSRNKPNVVILNSGRSPELNAVFAKLEELNSSVPGILVSLFGYTEWLIYAPYDLSKFYKYDTYIPTVSYYNPASSSTKALEQTYQGWFHANMQQALPRFAITGYDHAEYFIRGFAHYGKDFIGSKVQNSYSPLQTPLFFKKQQGGGYQNESFQLIHYLYSQSIESISY